MRIHSDTLTIDDVREALAAEKALGRIGRSVYFDVLTEHRSRTSARAFEVQLKAFGADDAPDTPKRRWANSGGYGASGDYAATYDEWGWFLANLYSRDSEALCGSFQYPVYQDSEHFHDRTGWTYDPARLIQEIEDYGDPFPYVDGQGAKTKKGYIVGRRGAGRSSSDRYGYLTYKPRTVEEVRAYARLEG